MNIIVMGCGKIETSIFEALVAEGHDVVAIDADPEVIKTVTSISDVIGVCGDGAEQELLLEEGIRSMDAFVSLTGIDSVLSLRTPSRRGTGYCTLRGKNGRA